MKIFIAILFLINSLIFAQDILGCTDEYAGNFNRDATVDDGSCTGYPDNGDFSLSFDGLDDYGYLPWNNELSSYTISMWVRAHDLNQIAYQAFFNNSSTPNQGFQLDCNNSQQYRLLSSNGSIILASLDLEWTHVAVTSDGNTTSAYFNGELVETVNWTVTGWDQIVLGRNRSTNNPGNYNIDEITIWNTVKTLEGIQTLMNQGLGDNEEGLLVEWKANMGSGDILFDHSGNSNHMTLHGTSWIDGNPGWPEIEISLDTINHLAYSGEISSELFTIYNNGDDDLEWIFNLNNQGRNLPLFSLPEGFTSQNIRATVSFTGAVIENESQLILNNSGRDQYNIWVYNNPGVSNVINGYENLNSVTGNDLDINNFDVFFNIRQGNNNPEEILEWIYNGGTWVGEWSSNDYPIANWNVISGNTSGGNSGANGEPNILDPSHWLAQNIEWVSVPVGTQAVEYMRNITIDDPDANVIVSLNHNLYGEVPLLVEKNYGEGTIILFNCDYQDDPSSVSNLIQKVAYYAAALAGEIQWLSVSDTLGTISPNSSQTIELTFDATPLDTGDYVSGFSILSNDPINSSLFIPIYLEVDKLFPNIVLSLDSLHIDLFSGNTLLQELTIQNNGEADLLWTTETNESWLTLSSSEGNIPIGESISINLLFDSNQLSTGLYTTNLTFMSNDEDEPSLTVPVILNIYEQVEAPNIPDTSMYEDLILTILLPDLYQNLTSEYSASSDTSDILVDIFSDSLIIQPTQNWTGFSNIELILTVNDTITDTSHFSLEVLPVNDSPVLGALNDTVMLEDSSLLIELDASDIDNEDLEFSVSSSHEQYLIIEIVDSNLFITPIPDFNGDSLMIEVSVSDNIGRIIVSDEFMLTVLPVNDPPIALNETYYIDEDSDSLFVHLFNEDGDTTSTNTDNQTLNFTVLGGFQNGVFDLGRLDGHLVYVSNENYFGPDSMTYIVTDDGITGNQIDALSDTATITINVLPVNDSPIISFISDTSMNEDSFLHIPLHILDYDNDTLSIFGFSSDSSYISVIANESYIQLNSYFNWHGTDIITIVANDNVGRAMDIQEFQITVYPVNDPPEIENQLEQIIGVGLDFEFHLIGSDVDSDSFFFQFDTSYDYPNWLSLDNSPYRLIGNAPSEGTFQIPIIINDGQEANLDSFQLSSHYFEPRIVSVEDVPDDQGQRVYLNFQKSYFDDTDSVNQFYTIYRLDNIADSSVWVSINSISANGNEYYVTEVSTLNDSTDQSSGLTNFKVIGFLNPGVYQSESFLGYSVDNLAPEAPEDLELVLVEDGVGLSWHPSESLDLDFYQLERSTYVLFDDFDMIEVESSQFFDSEYDENQTVYYRVSAVDNNGNSSDYSVIVSTDVLNIKNEFLPISYKLYQNYPNPFNPLTTISYDLPIDSEINLIIYDINGRIIKSLYNGHQDAGSRSIIWDATNNLGDPVSSGMYLYSIQSKGFNQTRKMLFLK